MGADFVTMMNAVRTCVIVHDADTLNILWANPAACELLEFGLDEIRPLKSTHMSSPAEEYGRESARAWLHVAADTGTNRIEWHYRSKSGRVIPTDAVATRIELAQGPVVMVQFHDIERSQQVERELRLTSAYVTALARHTGTLAIMLDREGTIRLITDSLARRLSRDHDAALDLLSQQATLRIDGQPASWSGAARHPEAIVSVQLHIPTPDGVLWLEGSLERLADEDEGILLLVHDATGRVESEIRRDRERHQENYLARYNAMGDMAMAIAHELGQPLAAAGNFLAGLRTHVESLPTDPDAAQVRRQLAYGIDSSVAQIERASSIVSAVRRFVGHLEQVEQRVDLNAIVEECLYFVRLRALPAWVQVDVHLEPEPVWVTCEPVLTGQVVMNLCFNAIEEMLQCPRGTRRISVTTTRGDGTGTFAVDDHGRGLPRDPFEGTFTSKAEGSGIGLALSYRIITRQHGDIWAERRPEGGSRFAFTLPDR